MCVGVPARILEITPGVLPMARVDLAGEILDCCLAYVPDAVVGDHVLVQNGFAVDVLDAEAAAASFEAFASLGVLIDPGVASA